MAEPRRRTGTRLPGRRRPVVSTGVCVALLALFAQSAACSGGSAGSGGGAGLVRPQVGRPAMPTSVAMVEAAEPLNEYLYAGSLEGDPLAPNETIEDMLDVCMTKAGYGNVIENQQLALSGGSDQPAPQPMDVWGFIGMQTAAATGFAYTGTQSGIATGPLVDTASPESGVFTNCENENGPFDAALTSIGNLTQNLYTTAQNDTAKDPDVVRATQDWASCMSRNGFDFANPQQLNEYEQQNAMMMLMPAPGGTTEALANTQSAQYKAQLAAAVSDVTCTESSDLAGIYFAVLDDYQQQEVTANQDQLYTAVQDIDTAYQQEASNYVTKK